MVQERAGDNPTPEKLEATVKSVLKDIVQQHRRVVFDGDNYDVKWHEEAERRGLPNFTNAVDALGALKSKKALTLFSKYGVLDNRELHARVEVLWEQYNTIMAIEARTMAAMLKTQVMPAALRHLTELAEAVAAAQAAGVDCEDTRAQLQEVVDMVDELRDTTEAVEQAETGQLDDSERQAEHIRDTLIPAMDRARKASDALESVIADDLWRLPTYAEMLFLR